MICPAPTGKDFSMPRSDISGILPVGSHGASVSADDDERLNSMFPPRDIKRRAGRLSKKFTRFPGRFVRCRDESSQIRTVNSLGIKRSLIFASLLIGDS